MLPAKVPKKANEKKKQEDHEAYKFEHKYIISFYLKRVEQDIQNSCGFVVGPSLTSVHILVATQLTRSRAFVISIHLKNLGCHNLYTTLTQPKNSSQVNCSSLLGLEDESFVRMLNLQFVSRACSWLSASDGRLLPYSY
jgi:hypothetical protein